MTAPVLAAFSFAPALANVGTAPATVTFEAHITDDISGLGYWCVGLTNPSGQWWAAGDCLYPPPQSGTINNGVFQGTITIPQYAEAGTWRVGEVKLADNVGNASHLYTAQLEQSGFPTELLNGPPTILVQIDIKPGSYPNSINLGSGGTVAVAIFSTPSFDARTVDPASVTLAGAAVALKGKGTPMASVQDVNSDGLPDLVVHVSTEALQLSAGDTLAVLEGKTFAGTPIRGSDTVRIVP